MNWSFRTKLIVAFLLFSLVPALVLTFVMFGATEQLKDRAARTIWRNAISPARALSNSILLTGAKPPLECGPHLWPPHTAGVRDSRAVATPARDADTDAGRHGSFLGHPPGATPRGDREQQVMEHGVAVRATPCRPRKSGAPQNHAG